MTKVITKLSNKDFKTGENLTKEQAIVILNDNLGTSFLKINELIDVVNQLTKEIYNLKHKKS